MLCACQAVGSGRKSEEHLPTTNTIFGEKVSFCLANLLYLMILSQTTDFPHHSLKSLKYYFRLHSFLLSGWLNWWCQKFEQLHGDEFWNNCYDNFHCFFTFQLGVFPINIFPYFDFPQSGCVCLLNGKKLFAKKMKGDSFFMHFWWSIMYPMFHSSNVDCCMLRCKCLGGK